jgi:hypothetical protein
MNSFSNFGYSSEQLTMNIFASYRKRFSNSRNSSEQLSIKQPPPV